MPISVLLALYAIECQKSVYFLYMAFYNNIAGIICPAIFKFVVRRVQDSDTVRRAVQYPDRGNGRR